MSRRTGCMLLNRQQKVGMASRIHETHQRLSSLTAATRSDKPSSYDRCRYVACPRVHARSCSSDASPPNATLFSRWVQLFLEWCDVLGAQWRGSETMEGMGDAWCLMQCQEPRQARIIGAFLYTRPTKSSLIVTSCMVVTDLWPSVHTVMCNKQPV